MRPLLAVLASLALLTALSACGNCVAGGNQGGAAGRCGVNVGF